MRYIGVDDADAVREMCALVFGQDVGTNVPQKQLRVRWRTTKVEIHTVSVSLEQSLVNFTVLDGESESNTTRESANFQPKWWLFGGLAGEPGGE